MMFTARKRHLAVLSLLALAPFDEIEALKDCVGV